MLRRFNMRVLWEQFSIGQFFPIRFSATPHFAGPRTPSGKGYARGCFWRMMRVREIVAQWIASIQRIDSAFRKLENTRVAVSRYSKTCEDELPRELGANLRERVCEV